MESESGTGDRVRAAWKGTVLRIVGAVLTVVCCLYVWRAVEGQWAEVRPLFSTGGFIVVVVSCSLLWVLLNVMLGLLWRFSLKGAGGNIGVWDSVQLSLRTQIAKYLPGNVFHLAGRVALAGRYGVSKTMAGLATAMEAVALLLVAGVLSIRFVFSQSWGIYAVGIGILGIFGLVLLKGPKWRDWLAKRGLGRGVWVRYVALALVCSVSVFVIQTLMFVWIEITLFEGGLMNLANRIEIVSASWAAGFVVVGSPGGLGVREFVISFFATDELMGERFAIVAAVTRLCSIAGDLFSFLLSFVLRPTASNNG